MSTEDPKLPPSHLEIKEENSPYSPALYPCVYIRNTMPRTAASRYLSAHSTAAHSRALIWCLKPSPHSSQTLPWQCGFVCLEWRHKQTDTAGSFFFLWERAGFKGDICVKKLFSHQPLLRCPERKGRVGEEWHIIKWTIKKFPNFWLQLTSELSPVPISRLKMWWTQAAKLVWGVS